MKEKLRSAGGYIVVETIACFLLFVFLVVSIISLINIVTVQARVHYALTQAAETVSMYSYVLEVTGLAKHMENSAGMREHVEQEADEMKGHINDVIDGIQGLMGLDGAYPVFLGASQALPDARTPVPSPAAEAIVLGPGRETYHVR